MPLDLREGDVGAFFDVPFHAYGPCSPFVQPLRGDLLRQLDATRNPLFRQGAPRELWTVHRDGVPVGRITCHLHPASNALHREARACFGYFDCVDDLDCARLLLGRAEAFARAQHCTVLAGNFSLTAMQQIGVLTDGFNAVPYVDQQWNPPHVPRLLEALGFAPTFPMRTFEVALDDVDVDALTRRFLEPARADRALAWRTLAPRDIAGALDDIRVILNDSFAHNPMFVPLTADEMAFQADGLTHVLDPALTRLVHDDAGPAGVLVCIPDLNPFFRATRSRLSWRTPAAWWRLRTRRDRAVVIFGGVTQRRQRHGLAGALLASVVGSLRERGYRRLGITWISDDNHASLAQMARLGATPMHRLALYGKAITP